MIDDNKNTNAIINYFNKKYGEPLGIVGLAKSLSVVSVKAKQLFSPLSILAVTMSQNWKTRSSIEVKNIFKSLIIEFGSDFTIHSLMKKYNNGRDLKNKIGSINDMTILFSSKADRTKGRLLGAFAESLSDGIYTYSDNQTNIEWKPERWGIIGNITFEKYDQMKQVLIDSTLMNRLVPIFYEVDKKVMRDFNIDYDNRVKMKFSHKLGNINILDKLFMDDRINEKILDIADVLEKNSLSGEGGKCFEKVRCLVLSNVCLNNRKEILDCDFDIAKKIINMTYNPMEDTSYKLLNLLRNGYTIKKLIKNMGYSESSSSWLYGKKKKFQLRGLLK